jgi:hypothetical protein
VLANWLLTHHVNVFAAIGLDQLGSTTGSLRVAMTPSGDRTPPLGLVAIARGATMAEGGTASLESTLTQTLRLGVPVTLFEHGQLVQRGLPAVTITSGSERLPSGRSQLDEQRLAQGVRSIERTLEGLDAMDSLQSAGKTWAWSGARAWRGWALKILIASLLLPVWLAGVDMFARYRRSWHVLAAVGSVARAMLAGVWAIGSLWALTSLGLLNESADLPPSPALVHTPSAIRLTPWVVLVVVGWLLARGPDWRRRGGGGRDHATLVVGLLVLVLLATVALAVNPFAVAFAVPALHAWLWLASRRVWSRRAVVMAWTAASVGPLVACMAVAGPLGTGTGTPWYLFDLLALRDMPPALGLLLAPAVGVGVLLLLAALDVVHLPALHRLTGSGAPRRRRLAAVPTARSRISSVRGAASSSLRSAMSPLRDLAAGARTATKPPSPRRASARDREPDTTTPAQRAHLRALERERRRQKARR